jgi:hypothetical protein
MGLWDHATLEPWDFRTMKLWDHGTLGPRPANNIFLSGRLRLKSNNFCGKVILRVIELEIFDMIAHF